MPRTSKTFPILIIIVLLLLQLLFLFFVKYHNQDLTLAEFSLKKIGNNFNVLVYSGLVLGIYITQKKVNSVKTLNNIKWFVFTSWLLLIISFISTKVKIFSQNVYFFNQQGDKVFTGILFLLFLFVLLYFFISIWNKILIENNSIVRDLFSTVLMMILFLLLTFIYISESDYSYSEKKLTKNENNIAVVLGAAVWSGNIPSPTLSLRVDKALSLLSNGYAQKIVLTGGNAPGELAESEVAYEYAKVKGVDTTQIIIERKTSSTADQIKWIKKNLMLNKNSYTGIILVSDGYHLPRAIEISKFFNLDVKAAKSIHELSFREKIFTIFRESIALFFFWNFAL